MKTLKQQIESRCKNLTGMFRQDTCKAGVRYEDVKDTSQRPYRFPCRKDDGAATTCPLAIFPTAEEVQEELDSYKRSSQNINTARAAIVERTGGRRGSSGSIECPVCHSGRLNFSVSGYNGHIHATCSTAGCVSWME